MSNLTDLVYYGVTAIVALIGIVYYWVESAPGLNGIQWVPLLQSAVMGAIFFFCLYEIARIP